MIKDTIFCTLSVFLTTILADINLFLSGASILLNGIYLVYKWKKEHKNDKTKNNGNTF